MTTQAGKTYFISDLHMGHKNAIKFDRRPWKTIGEMNSELVNRWNETVTEEDHVYVLGDMFHKYSTAKHFLPQLKGHLHLVVGNHDQAIMEHQDILEMFETVDGYVELDYGEYKLILSHYPMIAYNKSYLGNTIHLYGHVHTTQDEWIVRLSQKLGREMFADKVRKYGLTPQTEIAFAMINVGCMMPWMDYRPRTLEELMPAIKAQIEEVETSDIDELIRSAWDHNRQ